MKEFIWSDYINDTVIISLKSRDDRKEKLDKRIGRIGLNDGKTLKDESRYFDAIDTQTMSKFPSGIHQREYDFDYHYLVDEIDRVKKYYGTGESVVTTEVESAITFSHYAIWKNIVDNKIPVTLILEDDIAFSHDFLEKLGTVMTKELPKDWDLFYLSYLRTASIRAKNYSPLLHEVYNGLFWLSGYMLTYEGAKKLLDNLPVIGPVDVWINYQFEKMKTYAMTDQIIWQAHDTQSSNSCSFGIKYW
jgi:GR25 family glycosyltransferase involved in LPS biosynthesis